jgi:hypothetical protein
MKITINLPDDVPYWYKPVIWFIDRKDESWTIADLMQSICTELQLDPTEYSLTGVVRDGEIISVTRNK